MKLSIIVRLGLLSAFTVLASCTTLEPPPEQPAPLPSVIVQSPVIQEDQGELVVRHLTERYADTRENCGRPSQPSFLCNGIMIRSTADNATFHVWNNSPASISKGGVSFSYLRADSNFRSVFRSSSGYIFQAYFFAGNEIQPQVLCSFPIDAATDRRQNAGCGEYPGLARTDLCHLYGVATAAQWWADYSSHNPIRHYWQCGFDVRDTRNELAGPAFAASVDARRYLNVSDYHNEMIVQAWADDLGKTLPLEAFFYISGSAAGLSAAKRNQRDLDSTDGVVIPVIKVNMTPPVSFTYSADDQEVPVTESSVSRHE